MLGFLTEDKPIALASALTYWCFRCRVNNSPANGLKTWDYMQSSIQNAAIPSRTLNDYIVQLCHKLIVPTLKPQLWRKIVVPTQVVLRAALSDDGAIGDLQQLDKDQGMAWQTWEQILDSWKVQYGITERHVLKECLFKPQLVALYVRLKHEEEKALWLNQEEEETIDV
jgi:hypothetical protein